MLGSLLMHMTAENSIDLSVAVDQAGEGFGVFKCDAVHVSVIDRQGMVMHENQGGQLVITTMLDLRLVQLDGYNSDLSVQLPKT
jgi:hypothetical protein